MAENFLGGDGPLLGFPIEETCPKNPPRLGFLKRCLEPSVRKRITAEVCVVGMLVVKHLGGCWGVVEK